MNNKFKYVFTLGGFIILVITVSVFMMQSHKGELVLSHSGALKSEKFVSGESLKNEKENIVDTNQIIVYVVGAVHEPGIVVINEKSRLYEVIALAGGVTEDADLNRINLASTVKDEQKIVIPFKVVSESGDISSQSYIPNDDYNSTFYSTRDYEEFYQEDVLDGKSLININTASKSQLETLSGIGSSIAEKIIRYRKENGYFKSIEEIQNVSGIGSSKFKAIKDDITV